MRVKSIVAEDFCNYKQPSLFIVSAFCDWKCCTELGMDVSVCQNAPLASQLTQDVPDTAILTAFVENPITQAVVIGGLETMLQINELRALISLFRHANVRCPFIIYTGYIPDEIDSELQLLRQFENIIVKFGRYNPNRPPKHDPILGITLISDNQYAEQIC